MENVLTPQLQREVERTLGLDEKSVWDIFVDYTKNRLNGHDVTQVLNCHFVYEELFEAELRDRVEGEFLLYSKRNGLLDSTSNTIIKQ